MGLLHLGKIHKFASSFNQNRGRPEPNNIIDVKTILKSAHFAQECQKNKSQIDFEPKSCPDFVESIGLLTTIEGTIESLKRRTIFLENLFGLMAEYLIPLSGEDTSMLAAIKAQLGNIQAP